MSETTESSRKNHRSLRVYFGVNGIGSGHIKRSLHVAHELRKKGIKITFSTYSDPPASINLIKSEGFPATTVWPIKWVDREDGTIDVKRSVVGFPRIVITLVKQIVDEVRNLLRFDPDLVVSDARLSTIFAAKILRRPVILLNHVYRVPLPEQGAIFSRLPLLKKAYEQFLNLILFFLWYRADYHLVPDFPPPFFLSTETLALPNAFLGKLQFIGAILPGNIEYANQKDPSKDESPHIFLVIGGTPTARKKMGRTMGNIVKSLPEYQYTITLGDPCRRAYKTGDQTESNRIEVFGWIDDPHPYFQKCDVIITRPGHNTVTEGLLHGRPMLLFPIRNHLEYVSVAKKVEEMGLGILVLDEDISVPTVKSALAYLLSPQCKKRSKNFALWARKFNGLKTAVQVILDQLNAP